MKYSWIDLAGNVGVLLILVAYLLLQLGKLSSSSFSYSVLNALGALLLVISLLVNFNLSALLMELCWLLISLFALLRNFISQRSITQS